MVRASTEEAARPRIASQCDLFLDHLLYGAHTTGADALWAAVPLLTINGWGGSLKDQAGRFSSRVGASLVRSLGLEKYVLMDTLRDFEDVAVDVPRHKLEDGTLAATAREPLFDAGNSVSNVEKLCRRPSKSRSLERMGTTSSRTRDKSAILIVDETAGGARLLMPWVGMKRHHAWRTPTLLYTKTTRTRATPGRPLIE